MGLFKPKWVRESEAKDRAAAKAQRAVERLTDPNDLIRAALESPWGTAKLSAVARLDDDVALLAVLNAATKEDAEVYRKIAELRGGKLLTHTVSTYQPQDFLDLLEKAGL